MSPSEGIAVIINRELSNFQREVDRILYGDSEKEGLTVGYDDHTPEEYRKLADELWDRGFKEISSHIHYLAGELEHKRTPNKVEDLKTQKTFRQRLKEYYEKGTTT